VVPGEDAGEVAREDVRKEEVVGVDDVAPRAADAPGHGEATARETSEDVEEEVVGEADAVAGVLWVSALALASSLSHRHGQR
jgi:hypothetical protein